LAVAAVLQRWVGPEKIPQHTTKKKTALTNREIIAKRFKTLSPFSKNTDSRRKTAAVF
jgi:hypothetical protein